MPDYMIWAEDTDESYHQVFGGATPQDAIRNFSAEQDGIDGVIVYARECERIEFSSEDGPHFRAKPGGKCWSAQVDVEMTPTYNVGALVVEDAMS